MQDSKLYNWLVSTRCSENISHTPYQMATLNSSAKCGIRSFIEYKDN